MFNCDNGYTEGIRGKKEIKAMGLALRRNYMAGLRWSTQTTLNIVKESLVKSYCNGEGEEEEFLKGFEDLTMRDSESCFRW